MSSANIVRWIGLFALVYLAIRISLNLREKPSNWRVYVLPLAWFLHALAFYVFTILRASYGYKFGLSVDFLNYWSQLLRMQIIVSLGVMLFMWVRK